MLSIAGAGVAAEPSGEALLFLSAEVVLGVQKKVKGIERVRVDEFAGLKFHRLEIAVPQGLGRVRRSKKWSRGGSRSSRGG